MATKKQRRRREKEQRHDYVWVDDEGNEVDVDPAGSEKEKEAGSSSSGRLQREPQAPSWQRTFKRGAIFAPIMFGTVLLLSPDLPMETKLTQTLLIVAIFIPFSYFIDRFFYRTHLKRRARARADVRPAPRKLTRTGDASCRTAVARADRDELLHRPLRPDRRPRLRSSIRVATRQSSA